MRRELQRRLLHGGRGYPLLKRAMGDEEVQTIHGAPSNILTGPITILFTRTISAPSTFDTFTPPTVITPVSTISTLQTTTVTSSSSEVTSSETPSTPLTSTNSLPSTKTTVGDNAVSSNTDSPEPVAGSVKPSSLPPGALIGIVLICLAVLIGTIIYAVRRRYVRRRIRLRKEWAHSKSVRTSLTPNDGSYGLRGPDSIEYTATNPTSQITVVPTRERKTHSRPLTMASRRPPSSISLSRATILPPLASYGTEPFRSPTSPQQGSPALTISSFGHLINVPSSLPSTPIYGPPSTSAAAPSAATVISTFITTLPDELSISVGETVRLLAEYDDGWALCSNGRGEQGMLPLECLDRGFTNDDDDPNRPLGGRAKRVSSLHPSLVNLRRF